MMDVKWVRESGNEIEQRTNSKDFKTSNDFLELWTLIDRDAPQLILSLVQDLTAPAGAPSIESLQELVQECSSLSVDSDMVLTAACAVALELSPQLETWLRVKEVWCNSWQVENWLYAAMRALAQKDVKARDAYIGLVKLLFNKLESGCLKSKWQRNNDARENSVLHWQSAEYPLDELWDGLRYADFMSYEEEMWVIGLLGEIAPTDFHQMLAKSSNAILIDAALIGAGAGAYNSSFSQWESFVRAAPVAFSESGGWTRSPVLPLLLAHARNELFDPGRNVPRYDADEVEVAALTAQVSDLVCAVVGVLASRDDAEATFRRWSTWLMRKALGSTETDFSDIRSPNFVNLALLDAIGKAMRGRKLPSSPPIDAAPWEAWCYLCVRSSFAHEGFTETPSLDDFAREWNLTPESWHGSEGRMLLKRAYHHLPRDEFPDLTAQLLVAPFSLRSDFSSCWLGLWNNACFLREVLEFGSWDSEAKSYSDRVDASHLLLLLGSMGLACFDQAASRLDVDAGGVAKELIKLHQALTDATLEVLYVDDTLHRGKWKTLLKHLAVRRVYWDSEYTLENRVGVFAGQSPSIRDFLVYFQADPSDLVGFLHACMLNQLDDSALRMELLAASVDLRACVETLKKLHRLREHGYPFRHQSIKAIQVLMS